MKVHVMFTLLKWPYPELVQCTFLPETPNTGRSTWKNARESERELREVWEYLSLSKLGPTITVDI